MRARIVALACSPGTTRAVVVIEVWASVRQLDLAQIKLGQARLL